jgi:flavin reductase (DIM6/NTAB) family NADH-FMN oxidoreductase RutF
MRHSQDFKALKINPFKLFDEDWGLVTAGTPADFNTMTIGWGTMGSIWGKPGQTRPVVTVYVKPVRHTFGYLNASEAFTVSFFDAAYHRDLMTLGTLSGRDGDKVAATQLTPAAVNLPAGGRTVTFREAKLTLVCQKLYAQDLDINRIPVDVVAGFYAEEAPHRQYIGQVTDMLMPD